MGYTFDEIKKAIAAGETVLGMELGSTRIKAVLIMKNGEPIVSGSYDWENQLLGNIWTYSLEDVWKGVQTSFADLQKEVLEKYGVALEKTAAMGFSAMMHGYLAFDKEGNLLVPFRTWRNTITGEAAEKLTALFDYNIPQRWSIAHLYQAILNGEEHVPQVAFFTTLAGYLHWKLTGEKVIGVGDASGMFPIDTDTCDFDQRMIDQFDALVAEKNFGWKLRDLLPKVLVAGQDAGVLTEEGAKLLDPTGVFKAGVPICPPEGDAGTGMAATNSVKVRTGNVSAGTSVFAMIVLEKALQKVHMEIDLVTTPTGKLVGMVHCNNCTSDLNAWVMMLKEYAESVGAVVSRPQAYDAFYFKALEAEPDCGGVMTYGYYSGEPITGFTEGRPLMARTPESNFSLANLARSVLFSALGALKVGMDILLKEENVAIDEMFGHGGLFKTKDVGQKMMAAAIDAPVSVMETAGEGGPWGMALLASYLVNKEEGETLDDFLSEKIFAGNKGSKMDPDPVDVKGFDEFIVRYKACLPIEAAAVETLK